MKETNADVKLCTSANSNEHNTTGRLLPTTIGLGPAVIVTIRYSITSCLTVSSVL
jgi:hypothetical protein